MKGIKHMTKVIDFSKARTGVVVTIRRSCVDVRWHDCSVDKVDYDRLKLHKDGFLICDQKR